MLGWGAEETFQRLPKESLRDQDINLSTWESLGQDPRAYRGTKESQKSQSHQRGPVRLKTNGPLRQRKRAAPKARATFNSIAAPTHSCPIFGQAFWLVLAPLAIYGPTTSSWSKSWSSLTFEGQTTTRAQVTPLFKKDRMINIVKPTTNLK